MSHRCCGAVLSKSWMTRGGFARVIGILPATPAGRAPGGEAIPETVILRLMNTHGRPAVKLATSDQGAGISLTGSFDSHETYVTLGSSGRTSQLKLRNEDGRQQLFKP